MEPKNPCENCGKSDWEKYSDAYGISAMVLAENGKWSPTGHGSNFELWRCTKCMCARIFSVSELPEKDFVTK
jgi:hypothetical protein